MTARALLTGIGGSIGCHVFSHLMHKTNWDVVGIDSFRHRGLTDRISHMFIEHPEWKKRLTLITHDLTAPISDLMVNQIGKIDYIFNIASLSDVHKSLETPVPFIKHNVDLAINMLEYARVAKPEVFLQISTDEVYGPTDGVTLHKEWDPIVPSNPYSASKAAQEAIAIAYWRSYGVPVVIVNLMNNFGEMQSPAKFPAIIQRKIRKGESIAVHTYKGEAGSRFYIHSRNSADAFLWIVTRKNPHLHEHGKTDKPDRFNIVGDKQVNNFNLIDVIAHAIGKPAYSEVMDTKTVRPGHDIHYGLDGSKLAHTGWRSPLDFETSMTNTVKWYEKHPEWLEHKE